MNKITLTKAFCENNSMTWIGLDESIITEESNQSNPKSEVDKFFVNLRQKMEKTNHVSLDIYLKYVLSVIEHEKKIVIKTVQSEILNLQEWFIKNNITSMKLVGMGCTRLGFLLGNKIIKIDYDRGSNKRELANRKQLLSFDESLKYFMIPIISTFSCDNGKRVCIVMPLARPYVRDSSFREAMVDTLMVMFADIEFYEGQLRNAMSFESGVVGIDFDTSGRPLSDYKIKIEELESEFSEEFNQYKQEMGEYS